MPAFLLVLVQVPVLVFYFGFFCLLSGSQTLPYLGPRILPH